MMYPDVPNPDLLCFIPTSARLVLDVGCGAGALGAEYKRINPAAIFVGIERDKDSAEIAKQRLDNVFIADLDTNITPFADWLQERRFDCIVYGDVLEHVKDPWSLLKGHVDFLDPSGGIILCVPNVEHWAFVERLVRGTWRYESRGLFDATHLRWFTASSIQDILRSTGFSPVDVKPRTFDSASSENFVDALEPALRNLGVDASDYRQRSAPIQHVWRAQRQPEPSPLTVVSTMLSPVGGVSEVRVTEPMRALQADWSVRPSVIANTDDPPWDIDGPRIFIFHRPLLAGEPGLDRIKALLQHGWLVVCEFDDHPDYIPVLQRPDVLNFRGVHAIQTTTSALATILRRHNSEVAVFENAIYRLPETMNFNSNDRINMLFAGLNREDDWPMYTEALNAVCRRAGRKLNIEVINDRSLFDALETPQKNFTPLCSYDAYKQILARCEISFMPLLDTSFNRCKSDLKYIEAGSHRVAALASPIVYRDKIDDGVNGVLFRSPEDLEQRLSRLVANPDITLSIADAARRYVRDNRMLSFQIKDRVAWYHSLWERREALRTALLRRVPELAR